LNYNIPYVSWPRYEFIRDRQKSFSNISATGFASYALTRNGADPEQLNALQVTTSFFPTLGIMPLRGRNFTKEEDSVGGANVAILSYECWQRYFGGRDSIVGESIMLSGASYAVVGVLPPTLSQPFNTVMIFVPRVFEPQDIAAEQVRNGAGFLNVTARLKDGVTFGQATAEMRVLSENYNAAFSEHVDGKYENVTKTFAEELVGNFRSTFHLLLAAVGFVLLIACANVASLFLGRLSTRRKEIAVRLALGATRGQLVRQFLTESIVFSVAAGLLGVLLGCWALDLIQQIVAGAVGKKWRVRNPRHEPVARGHSSGPGWRDARVHHRRLSAFSRARRLRACPGDIARRGCRSAKRHWAQCCRRRPRRTFPVGPHHRRSRAFGRAARRLGVVARELGASATHAAWLRTAWRRDGFH
jgi:hypothetical protein